MPTYDYVCMTITGEYLRGEFEAANKRDLIIKLWEARLFLVMWREVTPLPAEAGASSPSVIAPQPIKEEEVGAFRDLQERENQPAWQVGPSYWMQRLMQ